MSVLSLILMKIVEVIEASFKLSGRRRSSIVLSAAVAAAAAAAAASSGALKNVSLVRS
jgi:hypothetical protein